MAKDFDAEVIMELAALYDKMNSSIDSLGKSVVMTQRPELIERLGTIKGYLTDYTQRYCMSVPHEEHMEVLEAEVTRKK